jgi:putative sterol carrier protein
MGLKIGSPEWLNDYLAKLNNNKAYEEAAAVWEGDFIFIFEPEGNLDHEIRLYLDLWHGKARSGRFLEPTENQNSEYIFSGKWGNWEKIMKGQLDPIKGLAMGKFKLKGNMAKVMRSVKSAQQLTATILMVDTDWELN